MTTPTIEPVEVALLSRNAQLPDAEGVLAHFVEFYQASMRREYAIANEDHAPDLLASEDALDDVADLNALAAAAEEGGLVPSDDAEAAPELEFDGFEDAPPAPPVDEVLFDGDDMLLEEDPSEMGLGADGASVDQDGLPSLELPFAEDGETGGLAAVPAWDVEADGLDSAADILAGDDGGEVAAEVSDDEPAPAVDVAALDDLDFMLSDTPDDGVGAEAAVESSADDLSMGAQEGDPGDGAEHGAMTSEAEGDAFGMASTPLPEAAEAEAEDDAFGMASTPLPEAAEAEAEDDAFGMASTPLPEVAAPDGDADSVGGGEAAADTEVAAADADAVEADAADAVDGEAAAADAAEADAAEADEAEAEAEADAVPEPVPEKPAKKSKKSKKKKKKK